MKKKSIRQSKSLIISLFTAFLCLAAGTVRAQAGRVTIDMQQVKMTQIMDEIEKQTKFLFIYDKNISVDRSASVQVREQPVAEALAQMLAGTDLTYEINSSNIILSKRSADAAASSSLHNVAGVVLDAHGQPIIGASVVIKGTTIGISTNVDGSFGLQIPASVKDPVLVVNYLGCEPQEIAVGSRADFRITMVESAVALDNVVVTALGIKRQEKALSYNVQQVKSEDIVTVKDANFMNALNGKVAGVQINSSAAGVGGAARVVMRGAKSLYKDNNALYVIDGIPMSNVSFGSNDDGLQGNYMGSDGVADINPDDIENISVLKGPAASALYGSQAGNGVIMITTKKASSRKGQSLGVEINSTTTVEQQLTRFDDVQYIYGQGSNGRIYGTIDDRSNSSKSWGPKIDKNLKIWYFDNVLRPYTISNHGIEDFFRLGVTANNSITLNKIYKDAGIRLSYSDLRNRDIVPNSGMNRSTFTVRTNTKIGRKIDVDVKVNYVYEKVNNRPALAGDRNNVGKNLSSLPSTYDLYLLRDNYKDEEGKYYNWNGDVNRVNPYWTINEMSNTSKKNRLISSASISYKITDKLKFKLSGGADITEFSFEDFAPISTPSHESGYLKTQTNSNRTINADAVLTYSTNLGKNMSLVGTAGLNLYRVDNFQTTITGKDMAEPDIKKINSFSDKTIVESPYQKQINSAYAMVNLGYKNFAYLDVTVRADNTSTLINNTYVYPSVSGSFIFSELLPSSVSRILSFGKVRASWAEVGNDTSPYQMSLNYGLYPHPVGGVSSGQISNSTVPNRDLKPTRTRSWEVGMDLRLWQERLTLDITYYKSNTNKQTFQIPISGSSGYSSMVVQSGCVQNKGVEAVLGVKLRSGDFSYNASFAYTLNRNKIKSMVPYYTTLDGQVGSLNQITKSNIDGGAASFLLREGGTMGDLWTKNVIKKDEDGNYLVNAGGKLEIVALSQKVGSVLPKYTLSMNNDFRYKGFRAGFQLHARVGGKVLSATQAYLDGYGVSKASAEARDNGGIPVNQGKVDAETWYTTIGTGKVYSHYIYNATNIRLQEASIGYTLPKRWFRDVCSIDISLVGRNLWLIYCKAPFDPESASSTDTYYQGIDFFMQPSLRSYGFSVKLNF